MVHPRFDRNLLVALLESVVLHRGSLPGIEQDLCLFAPICGSQYRGELMVVGRAVNGWEPGFRPSAIVDPEARDVVLDGAYKATELSGPTPLKWVADQFGQARLEALGPRVAGKKYNALRSAFWRTIHALATNAEVFPASNGLWPERIVWSNLYKVAPKETGNPSGPLQALQRETAIALLHAEIAHWQPKRILLLTGWNWAEPFLQGLDLLEEIARPPTVKAIRRFSSGPLAVVCPHPQGRGKDESAIVADAIAAFRTGAPPVAS